MATIVFLGGNSIKNKSWIQEVSKEVGSSYDTTYIHHYRHWDQEEGDMDIEYECEQLGNYLKTISGSIILFCKSLGCLLGLKIIVEQNILIKKCVFIGFPLGRTQLHTFPIKKYIKQLTCPVLRIQKKNDPAGGYESIAKEIGTLSPAFTCKEIPGDDHDYLEIETVKQVILDANIR